MSYIARLYDRSDNAEAAVAELKKWGFDPGDIDVVAPPAGRQEGMPADADAVAASMSKAGVAPEHTAIYGEGLSRGETLVVVRPPFTLGHTAAGILDSHHPVAVDVPEIAYRPDAGGGSSAAPLSAAMGWRVLSSDPTPLSTLLGWRTVKPQTASSGSLASVRKQSRQAAPLSRAVGMGLLSGNPAPLSSRVGWRTLWDTAAPLSGRVGWRTLLDNPAPLSSRLGMRTISSNPAPLSSALGWGLLSKNPAPLSSLFGWTVLKRD